MSITREFLEGIGIPDEHIQTIIDGHNATVEGIKSEIAELEAQNEESERLNAELEARINAAQGSEWKAKHDAVKAEFDAFKAKAEEAKHLDEAREAYKEILDFVGMPESRKNFLLSKPALYKDLEMDKYGRFARRDDIISELKAEWADVLLKKESKDTNSGSRALEKIRGKKA